MVAQVLRVSADKLRQVIADRPDRTSRLSRAEIVRQPIGPKNLILLSRNVLVVYMILQLKCSFEIAFQDIVSL